MSAGEEERLRLLADYGVLDTAPDDTLDDIVALAAAVCNAPISLISLVDERRQWFKARVGLDVMEMPREHSFCTHVVHADEAGVFAVEDARKDERFAALPLVVGEPKIVFYAGAPLVVEGGARLGALCVLDTKSRQLTALERRTLSTLANVIVRHLQAAREAAKRSAAEARLRATLTSIGDAVITTDVDGVVTLLNPIAEKLTGWSNAEAVGQPIASVFRVVDERTREAMESPVDRVLRQGSVLRLANHGVLLRRGADEVAVDDSAAPIRSEEGTLTGVILVFRDVSAQKRAEAEREALVARERISRDLARVERDVQHALFMQAPVAIATLEGREQIFTFANPAYRALVNGRDVVGKPLLEALPDVRDQGFDRLIAHVMDSGETFFGKEVRVTLDHHRAGEQLLLNFVYAAKRDAAGVIDGVLVSAFDVTELVVAREHAERLARQREADLHARAQAELDLRRIFDLSLDMLSTSIGGFFTQVNPAFQRVLGWTADELCSRPIAALVHPEESAVTAETRERTAHGGALRGFTSRYRHKDGSYRWISWNAVGEAGVTYAVGRDVTRERADEEARAALLEEQLHARESAERATRMMDEFLATVSHELRTPLNAMLGWTRLLRSSQVPQGQEAKALATIERNAMAQASLIEDLLDVSRIISGKMRLDVVPVEIVTVIEAAIDVVRPAAEAKGITLHALLDPAASHVTGDSARLQQVMWNLLANAVKFTPRGGRIRLRLVRVESSVEIVITDSGQGIAPEFIGHLFERFRQAEATISRSHGGLGLGLSIVKSIVELHGGTVAAESPGVGQGSTFRVRLPLSLVRPESAERIVAAHPRVTSAGPGAIHCPPEIDRLRVLVVDDENDARELLVAVLRGCGGIVTDASSAADALRALAAGRFDVVVSDLGMPHEDGYALLKQIRALPAASGGRTPAIALTAYARAEDRTRALRAGFVSHVAKPVEPSELLAVIASVVAHTAER